MTDQTGADVQITDRERWLCRALVAFPPRWRRRHEAEFMLVSDELASDESNSSRPPVKELAPIVKAGISIRVQDRPPWFERIRFRWAHEAPAPQWHGWARDLLERSRLNRTARTFCWSVVIWTLAWPLFGNNLIGFSGWLLPIGNTAIAVLSQWFLGPRWDTNRRLKEISAASHDVLVEHDRQPRRIK